MLKTRRKNLRIYDSLHPVTVRPQVHTDICIKDTDMMKDTDMLQDIAL